MLDTDELLAAYDEHMRPAEYLNVEDGVRVDRDGPVFRLVGRHRGFVSTPRDLGIEGAEVDRLIERQRDFFAARGEGVEWKTRGHDLPTDVPERLAKAGFVPEERETLVIGVAADIAAIPAPRPDGVEIREVGTMADFERIAAMESEIWGMDFGWLAGDLERRRSYSRVIVAEAGGELVCAAWLVAKYGPGFAGLWGGATRAEWRGRGVYRALVAHRARLAVERGITYLQVDASDDSRPILERLGFVAVGTTTPYVWTPGR
ncbi:GNAT family N-acetyltransferase [Kibdelosporangium lantanae]